MASNYSKYDVAAVEYYAELAGQQRQQDLESAWYQQGYVWGEMGFPYDEVKLPTDSHFRGWKDCIDGVRVVFLDLTGMRPLLNGAPA